MAIYRNVHISFWEDSKVVDELTPEERYFFLYILTNPHTNLIGCYEISLKQISNEVGYDENKINDMLKSLEDKHKLLIYSKQTKEILIKNWYKYNWTKSDKLVKPILNEIRTIKSKELKNYMADIGYRYGIDTTVTDTDSDNNSNNNSNTNNELFKIFWKAYPKKSGKGDIEKWFDKKKPSKELVDIMVKQVERFKDTKQWKKQDGQFIPNPSTWLNQKRWEDEFETEEEEYNRIMEE